MASNLPRSTKYKMSSVDDLFNLNEGDGKSKEQVKELEANELFSFVKHPFKVLDDEKMQDMVESVKEYGVLNPLLVRTRAKGGYEIISGHRRKHACDIAGIEKIPCIIREMSDEEAIILMVDSNIQREELLYSEKAYAYKMKLDAMKSQGKRNDITSSQVGTKSGERADVQLADQIGESKNQIHRYIRLTELIENLLERVDSKQIPFGVGVEISYLTEEEQNSLQRVMDSKAIVPNLAQATKMKQLSKDGKLDETGIELLLSQEKPLPATMKLERKKLNQYFPQNFSEEEKEQIIYDLLRKWSYEKGYFQDK